MPNFIDEAGLEMIAKYLDLQVMMVICFIIEFIKEIVNRIKPLVPQIDLPDAVYPVLSVFIGAGLHFVKELNVSLVVGACSGAVLTLCYKKFESWIKKNKA